MGRGDRRGSCAITGPTEPVLKVQFAAGGRQVVGFTRRQATVWDVDTGRTIAAVDGLDGPAFITPDGRRIVGVHDGIKWWDVQLGRGLLDLPLPGGSPPVAAGAECRRTSRGNIQPQQAHPVGGRAAVTAPSPRPPHIQDLAMSHPLGVRPARFRPSARRLRVESLEDRLAPATFTGAGVTLIINLTTAGEAVAFSTDSTTITAALTGGTATSGGGTGGNVTGFGTPTASINSAAFANIVVTDAAAGTAVAVANSTGAVRPDVHHHPGRPGLGERHLRRDVDLSLGPHRRHDGRVHRLRRRLGPPLPGRWRHHPERPGARHPPGRPPGNQRPDESDRQRHPGRQPAQRLLRGPVVQSPVVASVFDVNDLVLGASSFNFGTLNQTTRITAGGLICRPGP